MARQTSQFAMLDVAASSSRETRMVIACQTRDRAAATALVPSAFVQVSSDDRVTIVTAASTAHGSPGDLVATMRGCADSIQLDSDENLSTW